jgi:septal ring factor EnvC (AmiA/AmiB activator)
MKHVLTGLVMCALVFAVPARAAQPSSTPAPQGGDQKQVAQAIEKQQATVKQLQGDVAREEGKSHDADAKLKEKDQTIAELQAQLSALHAAPQKSGH